jgi:hypothetical protein
MSRDIDQVIEQVSNRLPGVIVWQHWVKNPDVDDDGIWWFRMPENQKRIQLESTLGTCPFMVEHDEMRDASEAEWAVTVEDAVQKVATYLSRTKDEA